jgi:hypothetical protein
LIEDQKEIPDDKVDKYIQLVNSFSKAKKFPSTLTSLLFNSFTIHGKYDEKVTIRILNATRFNVPFKELLLIDVFKHYLVDGLLADQNASKEEFVIAQDKVARKDLICAVYANLIKITDVDFVKVALKYFLINDYDSLGSNNPTNFINVMHQMISNCYIGG